eukprot:COSAG02_NODE_488_length_21256_cov_9.406579_1_plen_376_part_00
MYGTMLFHGVLGWLVVFSQFAVVHPQMAPAYRIDGAARSEYDGTYYRMTAAQCNGKPMYQLGGSFGGYVLFQPEEGGSRWVVGFSIQACDTTGHQRVHIKSSANGGSCAASPDGESCSGKWQEYNMQGCDDDWCHRPELIVQAVQCETVCGPHGSVPSSSGGQCECSCQDSYVGDFCQMAPAYRIDGAARSEYDGTYYRMTGAAQCNGKPMYQLGGSDGGYVLFQPEEGWSVDWMVSDSIDDTRCDTRRGYIVSGGNGGSCAASPDGAGCFGKWQEAKMRGCDDPWCHRPELRVTNPQCDGIHCGSHGDCVAGVCVCGPAHSGAHCESYSNGEGSDGLELLTVAVVALAALAVYLLYLLRRIFLSTADQLCIGFL